MPLKCCFFFIFLVNKHTKMVWWSPCLSSNTAAIMVLSTRNMCGNCNKWSLNDTWGSEMKKGPLMIYVNTVVKPQANRLKFNETNREENSPTKTQTTLKQMEAPGSSCFLFLWQLSATNPRNHLSRKTWVRASLAASSSSEEPANHDPRHV